MLPDLNANDLFILEKHRLERLRSFFLDSLSLCFIFLDSNNSLNIHCPEPWLVDHLLNELNELRWYTWVVVGADTISICYAQEEIFTAPTRKTIRSSHPIPKA